VDDDSDDEQESKWDLSKLLICCKDLANCAGISENRVTKEVLYVANLLPTDVIKGSLPRFRTARGKTGRDTQTGLLFTVPGALNFLKQYSTKSPFSARAKVAFAWLLKVLSEHAGVERSYLLSLIN
jgi:hypothetical protein